MENFIWRKISQKEKEEIKKEVKSLLDSFSKKLSKISNKTDSSIERNECDREEGNNKIELNRNLFFKNAPEKNEDFIISEKKKW